MTDAHLREKLVVENPEYRRLAEQHRGYEERLTKLCRRPFLTPSEDIERIKIKKFKLQLKDRMEAIARTSRTI